MNHRERIHAAIRSEPVDHVPVALWRHFPGDDLRAEALAARVVEFQQKFDFDLVKVTPASGYPAEMYGATFQPNDNTEGTRAYVTRPVNTVADWDRIVPLPPTNPVFVRELAALKLIRAQLGGDVPILQTIFSPLNSALNIAGDRLYQDLRDQPAIIHRALRAIAETTAQFAIASLRAGADSVFFATQMATPTRISLDEFHTFGEPYDRAVLDAIHAANPDFVLLHIHGLDIFFEALTSYPAQIINWHDQRTPPALQDAKDKFMGARMGGINEKTGLYGSRDAIIAHARQVLEQVGTRGFVLGAGCVIQIDAPEENIRAVTGAVRG